jgi:hypothetical protein
MLNTTEILTNDAPQARTFSATQVSVVTFYAVETFGPIAGGELIAKSPILVRVTSEEDVFCLESDEYDIYTSGDSFGSALADFSDHLKSMYLHYARAHASNLNAAANGLKNKMAQDFLIR